MALINCPECNKQVSNKAIACPNCAYPITFPSSSPPASTSANQRNKLRNCPDCVSGEIKKSCNFCGGTGTEVCGLCNGSGFTHMTDEAEICYSCHGRNSRFTCTMCAGNGYELYPCQTCDGSGQLTFEDYDAVLEQRKQIEIERKKAHQKAEEESEQKRKEKEQEKKRKGEEDARAAEERKRQEGAKRQSEAVELQRLNAEEERKQLTQKVTQSNIISDLLDMAMGVSIVLFYIYCTLAPFPIILGWSLGILIPLILIGLKYYPLIPRDITDPLPVPCYIPPGIFLSIILGMISGALICGISDSYAQFFLGNFGVFRSIFNSVGGLIEGVVTGLIVGGVVGLFIGLIKQTLKVGEITQDTN